MHCLVFELENDRKARTQGGSLDLHEGSAQKALKEAGLFEQFMKHARPEGETLRIIDPSDQILLDESQDSAHGRPNEMHGRPEIDRVLLRDMLLDSLEPASVIWGHKLVNAEKNAAKQYELHFGSGSRECFDLVIGADGAWSKVRPLITSQKPVFSGITGIDIKISDPDVRHPDLSRRVGRGMCLTLGENKGVLAQRDGNGDIRIYALMRAAENWHEHCRIDWTQHDAAKRAFVEGVLADWSVQAKDLILRSDSEVIPRPIYMLPIGLNWSHKTG